MCWKKWPTDPPETKEAIVSHWHLNETFYIKLDYFTVNFVEIESKYFTAEF